MEDFEDENDVVVNKPQKLKGFNQLNVSALETVCINSNAVQHVLDLVSKELVALN